MAIYYFPGCKYKAHDPEKAQKLADYLQERHGVIVTGCCSVDHDKPTAEDTVLFQCPTCGLILSESARFSKLKSVYEFLLEDESFPWPDYQGEEMTVQDCWRMHNNKAYCDAVRGVAEKLNISYRELENRYETTDFCGATLYRVPSPRYETLAPESLVRNGNFHPLPEEQQKEKMLEHGQRYQTDEVICYCTGCLEGIAMSGHQPRHLLDLALAEL